MRLNKRQREHLLAAISEGLGTEEINARAELFRPPYKVSRQQVDFYRQSRGVKLREIVEESETSALKRGFALRENRVASLDQVAQALQADLLGPEGKGFWLDDVKAVGTGDFQQFIDFQAFNSTELQYFLRVLDDIAKEMGHRRQKVDVRVDPREALAKLLGVPVEQLPAAESDDAQS